MPKKSKKDMISIMKNHGWTPDCDSTDSWQAIKDEYDVFRDETTGDNDMFPNGRDYEAEDEDGPL